MKSIKGHERKWGTCDRCLKKSFVWRRKGSRKDDPWYCEDCLQACRRIAS